MSQKHPGELCFYRDLFDGEVFSSKNQKSLNNLTDRLREKIMLLLARENATIMGKSILANTSDHNFNYLKYCYHHSCFPTSLAGRHPIDYLSSLSTVDRGNLSTLLFDILYDNGDGIFRHFISSAMAVGSSTYNQEYWDRLSSKPNLPSKTIQRIDNRGNDIDIMLGVFQNISGQSESIQIITKRTIPMIKRILRKRSIPFAFSSDRKPDGTIYGFSRGQVYEDKLINYGCPNFTISFPKTSQLPKGRNIHLIIDEYVYDEAQKREFLEGRSHSMLFDGVGARYACQRVCKDLQEGKKVTYPQTLEEKYNQLMANKRLYYKEKVEYRLRTVQREREEREYLQAKIDNGTATSDDLGF